MCLVRIVVKDIPYPKPKLSDNLYWSIVILDANYGFKFLVGKYSRSSYNTIIMQHKTCLKDWDSESSDMYNNSELIYSHPSWDHKSKSCNETINLIDSYITKDLKPNICLLSECNWLLSLSGQVPVIKFSDLLCRINYQYHG